jgi:hypothetical protein
VVRRLARLLTLLALVTPGVALASAGTAVAATGHTATAHAAANVTKPGILQTAWFWQTAAEQANPPVAPPVAPPTEPSGVPKGDLAVAHTSNDDSSSKMSVVAFNLGALKPGATVESFSVTLTLDNSSSAANVGAPNPPVVACLPTRLWSAGEGNDYTNEPTVDCSNKVTPSIKGSAWTFTISSIAQQWDGQENLGVAFVNDPANTSSPFQAVFKGAKAITASMTYLPPIVSSGGNSTGGHHHHSSGGTSSTGGSTSSSSGSTAPPPAFDTGSVPSSGTTTTTTPPAGTTQPPLIAGTTPATPTTAAAVAHPRPAPSTPGRGFWIAGAALAVLIVCAAAVLADHQVPVPTAATTKLGQVLRERERSKASAAADGTPTLAPRQA